MFDILLGELLRLLKSHANWLIPTAIVIYLIWDLKSLRGGSETGEEKEKKAKLSGWRKAIAIFVIKALVFIVKIAFVVVVSIPRLVIESFIWSALFFGTFVLIVRPFLMATKAVDEGTLDIIAVLLFVGPYFIPLRDLKDAKEWAERFSEWVRAYLPELK